VFVANPNKPPQIATILRRNKDKLLIFLKEFHNDKDGPLIDAQWNDQLTDQTSSSMMRSNSLSVKVSSDSGSWWTWPG
jgi:hypothetical protein